MNKNSKRYFRLWKESLNSDGLQFTNINKTNNHFSPKESLNNDGLQFTKINKTNNHFSPQSKPIEHKKKPPRHMILEIQVLA